ncbi:MAG: basic amino acid ABC transporter substrate-binding protein [Holophaga sp.]|nr:basic amino acid ABC transporter substrate-binding protein [Holophaga sp.]
MKLMQKAILAVAALALAAMPALAAQPRLVFGSDCTFPPMEMLDANKQIIGFDVDMIRAVGKAAGFEAVVKNTSWDGIFAGLSAGDYDAVLSSVTITEERKRTMDFSIPYVEAGQVLIVNKTVNGVTLLSQFGGHQVGAQIGTTGAIEVAKYKNIKLKSYDEAGLAVEDLFVGRIDAVVLDSPTARTYVLQNPRYKTKLKIVGSPFTDEHYGIALKKGNTKALAMINRGLEIIKKDGTLARIAHKWLD